MPTNSSYGEIIQERRVLITLGNGTKQSFEFLEYEDGASRFRAALGKGPPGRVLPVITPPDNYSRAQKRAIFVLWMVVSDPEGHEHLPYFKELLSTLMRLAPRRERRLTRQQFKDSVFEFWNSEFFCSHETVDSALEYLAQHYLGQWQNWQVLFDY
jgi:hypothetical protein